KGARARAARARRAHRLRVEPSLAALGGHAAARLDRAGAVVRSRAAAHGRAVRRARRDDTRASEPRAAAHLGEGRQHRRLRHALDSRGRLPLDASRRHVGAAGARRRGDRRRSPAAAWGRDPRGHPFLRARHGCPRGARRGAWRGSGPACSGRYRGAVLSSTVVEPIPSGLGRELGGRLRDWLPALAVFVPGIVLWQGLTTLFHVQTFLLPKPIDTVTAFWDNKSTLWHAGVDTLKEALGGFAMGSGLGILAALFLA